MTVHVNGTPWELPADATLATVLQRLDAPPSGIAVAVDGVVVGRASWPDTALRDGSAVEVLTAVQGG